EAGERDRRTAGRIRAGAEERGHEGGGVESAAELEPLAAVPPPPDRPHGLHELAHAGIRLRPGLPEALLDVRADLRAEPENEAPTREELEVVREVGAYHRIAREGDRDRGREPHAARVLGRRRERQEGVVGALEREQPVEALLLHRAGSGARVAEVGRQQCSLDVNPTLLPLRPASREPAHPSGSSGRALDFSLRTRSRRTYRWCSL